MFKLRTTCLGKVYEVSLVTINRQTSYSSGILRQDFGIKRVLAMDHKRFADLGTFLVLQLPERAETIGPYYCMGPDFAVHA